MVFGEALFGILRQLRNMRSITWFYSSMCFMSVQRNPSTPELFCCWLPKASSTSIRNTVPALCVPTKQWEGRFGVSFTYGNLSKQGENQQHKISGLWGWSENWLSKIECVKRCKLWKWAVFPYLLAVAVIYLPSISRYYCNVFFQTSRS